MAVHAAAPASLRIAASYMALSEEERRGRDGSYEIAASYRACLTDWESGNHLWTRSDGMAIGSGLFGPAQFSLGPLEVTPELTNVTLKGHTAALTE